MVDLKAARRALRPRRAVHADAAGSPWEVPPVTIGKRAAATRPQRRQGGRMQHTVSFCQIPSKEGVKVEQARMKQQVEEQVKEQDKEQVKEQDEEQVKE
jgi:hypothetical protein